MNIVFYHKNCNDGLFAAYAAWKIFNDQDAIYVPMSYGTQAEDKKTFVETLFNSNHVNSGRDANEKYSDHLSSFLKGDIASRTTIYVVDYSFPLEVTLYLTSLFKKVVVIDHHKTAIERYREIIDSADYERVFDDSLSAEECAKHPLIFEEAYRNRLDGKLELILSNHHSGAMLSYAYFHPEEMDSTSTYVFRLVEDRDLWKFNYGDMTKCLHSGVVASGFKTFKDLDDKIRSQNGIQEIVDLGGLLENKKSKKINGVINSNLKIIEVELGDFETYKAAFINSTDIELTSDMSSEVLKRFTDVDIVISYGLSNDRVTGGYKVGMGIRSRQGVDSSVISSYFHGGGHAQASGCSMSLDNFLKVLKDGKLVIPQCWMESEGSGGCAKIRCVSVSQCCGLNLFSRVVRFVKNIG